MSESKKQSISFLGKSDPLDIDFLDTLGCVNVRFTLLTWQFDKVWLIWMKNSMHIKKIYLVLC